jgi:uncharacterized protein YcfJ
MGHAGRVRQAPLRRDVAGAFASICGTGGLAGTVGGGEQGQLLSLALCGGFTGNQVEEHAERNINITTEHRYKGFSQTEIAPDWSFVDRITRLGGKGMA